MILRFDFISVEKIKNSKTELGFGGMTYPIIKKTYLLFSSFK